MKLIKLKLLLIFVVTLAIFIKAGNLSSCLKFSAAPIENTSSTDDATEKEEKKVELECVNHDFFTVENIAAVAANTKRINIPQYFNKLAYFPEVLTPPPSAPFS